MRIVFMGSPEFAVPSLRALVAGPWDVAGVMTQPDRPKGRKQEMVPTPIKTAAVEEGIPTETPSRLTEESALKRLRYWDPDCIVVTAYGLKLPPAVLDLPPLGCVNVHPSLLPKYRGAEPIRWPILNGDAKTGVTTMYMDEGWDTGDTILQTETPIDPEETFGELSERLARMGAELLTETLQKIEGKSARRVPQPKTGATFAPRLEVEDELLDFARGASEVHNRIRALSPAPGAHTHWRGMRVKVFRSTVVEEDEEYKPGEVLRADRQHGLIVGTGSGCLELRELCPAGKNPMSAAAFINGYHPEPGDLFGGEDLGKE